MPIKYALRWLESNRSNNSLEWVILSSVTILIHGRDHLDQRDQPIVLNAVHARLDCMSEIIGG